MPPLATDALKQAFIAAYQPLTPDRDEVDVALSIVEGHLPDGLRGVLYRNGPGRLGVGSDLYGHLFDGDGMIARFELGAADGDGRPGIRYRNRYVRTPEFLAEERAGRILYRNFGTNRPGGLRRNFLDLRWKNSANTNVVYQGGKLLALWEGGLPYRLDPRTLETMGPDDFNGALRNRGDFIDRRLSPDLPFAAHPHADVATGDLYSFGMVVGRRPHLMLYRLGTDGRLAVIGKVPLHSASFLHDFVVTPNWLCFFVYPVAFDLVRALVGMSTAVESLRPLPGAPTQILLVPRQVLTERSDRELPSSRLRWLTADPCFVFHFANAFEDANGRLLVDGCRLGSYPELAAPRALLRGERLRQFHPILTRFTLDPDAAPGSRVGEAALCDGRGELPRVHPQHEGRPYRYAYAYGAPGSADHPYFNCMLRFDTVTGETRVRDFGAALPGEPVVVPRPGATAEDDAWVLSLVYDGDRGRSLLYVLDARDLTTVCAAALPHHVPPGFHGNFVAAPAIASPATSAPHPAP